MSGRARTTTEESASTMPTASASAHSRGFPLARSIPQLRSVLIAVLLLPFEHQFDVGAGFGISDVFHLQIASSPLFHRSRARVVRGKSGGDVPFVEFDPFGQQVGPVFDVDFGIGEVRGVEAGGATMAGDVLRRFGGDL